ncbi:hypothetical protein HOY82DRAFT_307853 [Tuber indicum]|nr:hypothetical protein HOY82DRAFT_307853 [Tuber indicum]
MRYRSSLAALRVSKVSLMRFRAKSLLVGISFRVTESLTVLGKVCLKGYNQLGRRASVLEDVRKQLIYFGDCYIDWKYCYCFSHLGSWPRDYLL